MEYTIQEAPKFENINASRTAYERANRDLPILRESLVGKFEEKLYAASGKSVDSMVTDVEGFEVNAGEIKFVMQAERRTGKPSYKTIVENWESYLKGVNFTSRNKAISGVLKRDGQNYMDSEFLKDSFYAQACGTLDETIRYVINDVKGITKLNQIVIPEKISLNEDCANAYFNSKSIADSMDTLVKAYSHAITSEAKRTKTEEVVVTGKVAYKPETIKRDGPNWTHVVQSLITMPTERRPKGIRELEYLADENFKLRERSELGGKYNLIRHNVSGTAKLYVGLNSLLTRINELKEERNVEGLVERAVHQERLEPLMRV